MYKVIIKFESESGNEKAIIQNEVEVYTCKTFECINDSLFGMELSNGEVIMIPIRRIRDIKVKTLKGGE